MSCLPGRGLGASEAAERLGHGCMWDVAGEDGHQLEGVSENRTAGAVVAGHDCHCSRKSYLMEVVAIISEGIKNL